MSDEARYQDVPQEWVDAAMAVLGDGEWDRTYESVAERQGLLAIALEAAAPIIAAQAVAAERQRLKVILGEQFKTVLAWPANGYLVDAVTWASVLDVFAGRDRAASAGGGTQ